MRHPCVSAVMASVSVCACSWSFDTPYDGGMLSQVYAAFSWLSA